jgi:2-polyprenyl-3-methyl-5-hydroxy-6-metoxy-1,4-benzoquinol methylase
MLEVGRGMGLTSLRQANAVAYLKAHPCEFDAIVANDFIEHLTKPEIFEFLDGAREALRPGGRLIMKTPNAACIYGARDRYVDFTHEVIFTAESATQVLLAAGLESVRVLPINGAPPRTPRSWVRFLLWVFLLRPILSLLARVIIGGRGHIHTVNILIVGERPRTA